MSILPDHLAKFINGCDSFPDGIGTLSWKHCCDIHDIAYTIGGSIEQRLLADWSLGECVAKVAGPIGLIMFLGVLLFGWLFYNYEGGPNLVTKIKRLFVRKQNDPNTPN